MIILAIVGLWACALPAGFYAGISFAEKRGMEPSETFALGLACAVLPPVSGVCTLLMLLEGEAP